MLAQLLAAVTSSNYLYLILALVGIGILAVLRWFVSPILWSWRDPPPLSYTHELVTVDSGKGDSPSLFPSIFDEASVYMSLIVPAYNESERLPVMLDEAAQYLRERTKQNKELTFEMILTNDGSKDDTVQVALDYARKNAGVFPCELRILDLKVNQGKGGAVQQGMLHARGQYVIFLDADGATNINDLSKVEQELLKIEKDGQGLAVGSRAHLAQKAAAKRAWYRNVLTQGFHFCVTTLAGIHNIRDTQCGFKMFTRNTARLLFANQHLRRWCFDVELLHIATHLGIPMVEVGVRWEEIPGSKINLIDASVKMGRDLVVIRVAYALGIWSVNSSVAELRKQHLEYADMASKRRL